MAGVFQKNVFQNNVFQVDAQQQTGLSYGAGTIAPSRKRLKQLLKELRAERKELKKERKQAAREPEPLVAQEVEPAASRGAISPSGILGPDNRAVTRLAAVAAGSTPTQDTQAALQAAQNLVAAMQAHAEQLEQLELLDEEEALIALLAA